MALEHERITVQECGCHQDKVTGFYTAVCPQHEAEREADLGRSRLERNQTVSRALMDRSGPPDFIDLDYFWTGYPNQAEVDRLRQAIRNQRSGSVLVLMGKLREAVSLAAKSYYRERPSVIPTREIRNEYP